MSTIVFQDGLLAPTVGADIVRDQLRLANRYRNDLTRWVRARRDAERELQLRAGMDVEMQAMLAAKEQLGLALDAIRASRKKSRSRSESDEMKATAKSARALVKEARKALALRREAVRPMIQAERDRLHERWLFIRRALREWSGLRHGTYIAVEASLDQACAETPLWDEGEPNDPSFVRWDGEGQIGVQLQGGRALAQVFGDDTFLRISRVPDKFAERGRDGRGGGRRRPQFAELWMRVGSDDDRAPVWAKWPMKMHRQIPDGSRVKRAMVSVRRCGPRELWTVELTVDLPDNYRYEPCGSGTVAIDVGWRVMGPGDLRVAAWHDDSGRSGTLRLTRPWIDALRKPQSLRSVRDEKLNAILPRLCAWMRERLDALPDWLLRSTVGRRDALPSPAQAVAWIGQWRSHARLASLERTWQKNRWTGDKMGYTMLAGWRYRDHHLWEWESAQRRKSLLRRRDLYRVWSAKLARKYGTIIVEDFDRRRVSRTPEPDEDPGNQKAMSNRQLSCTSELSSCIKNAASSRGAVHEKLNPADTTRECPWEDCGYIEKWDAAASVDRVPPCPKCNRTWDQDDGAAIVLLRRWSRERSGGSQDPAGARDEANDNGSNGKGETKWVRVARQRAEKVARMDAARNGAASEA